MTTPDLAPTRLDRARQKLADLLKARDGMPAGPDRLFGLGASRAAADARRATSWSAWPMRCRPRSCRARATGSPTPWRWPTKVLQRRRAGRLDPRRSPTRWRPARPRPCARSRAIRRSCSSPWRRRRRSTPTLPVGGECRASMPGRPWTTIDNADAGRDRAATGRRAGRGGASEAERWQEAGYWLTPLIALIGAVLVPPRLGAGMKRRCLARIRCALRRGAGLQPGQWAGAALVDARPARPAPDGGRQRYAEAADAVRRSDVARRRAVPRRRLQGGGADLRRHGHGRGGLRPGQRADHARQIRRGDRALRPRAGAAAGLGRRRGQPHARRAARRAREDQTRAASDAGDQREGADQIVYDKDKKPAAAAGDQTTGAP